MKQTLLALLLGAASLTAHATILFYASNEAGGTIQFSDMPCGELKDEPFLHTLKDRGPMSAAMIVAVSGKAVMFGCYQISEPSVHTVWSDGGVRDYPITGVTITSQGLPILKAIAAGGK